MKNPKTSLTFISWVDHDLTVYVTMMGKDLLRQLRIIGNEDRYDVEMLEITPDGGNATSTTVSDRELVYTLIDLNVPPADREKILKDLSPL